MRAKAEDRREWVRTMSRWRNARTARAYRGRRVAAVFERGCAGGDGGDLELVGCDKGVVVVASLTGMKGADGTVGDIVRVVVGMFSSGQGKSSENRERAGRVELTQLTHFTWWLLAHSPNRVCRLCQVLSVTRLGLACWAQQGEKAPTSGVCQPFLLVNLFLFL